jgi:hypothetical protein
LSSYDSNFEPVINIREQLVHALCTRKPFPKNLAIPTTPTHSTKLDLLLDLAFRIPLLLNTVDLTTGADFWKIDKPPIKSLITLEKALIAWLEAFCSGSPNGDCVQSDPAPRVTDSPPSDCRSSLFDLTCESLCRICLLLVVESLADLESWTWPTYSPTFTLNACVRALCKTTSLLAEVASIPVCRARATSCPLLFLSRYYTRTKDAVGLQWCLETKETIYREAPYLRWDALLPWSLLTLHEIPSYDARQPEYHT